MYTHVSYRWFLFRNISCSHQNYSTLPIEWSLPNLLNGGQKSNWVKCKMCTVRSVRWVEKQLAAWEFWTTFGKELPRHPVCSLVLLVVVLKYPWEDSGSRDWVCRMAAPIPEIPWFVGAHSVHNLGRHEAYLSPALSLSVCAPPSTHVLTHLTPEGGEL